MSSEITAAIIGIGGILLGLAASEGLQYLRRQADRKDKRRRLDGHLVGVFYELQHNIVLVCDLKKLHIRTFGGDTYEGIIANVMLQHVREHYDELDVRMIAELESVYSAFADLLHLIRTGPANEHEKWTKQGTEVAKFGNDTLAYLRSELHRQNIELPQLPNKSLQTTTGAGTPRANE